jgi:hypothetical protein
LEAAGIEWRVKKRSFYAPAFQSSRKGGFDEWRAACKLYNCTIVHFMHNEEHHLAKLGKYM